MSIGKIFNMDLNILNFYLDLLQTKNYLKVIRTAGIDSIYIEDGYSWDKLLLKYYEDTNKKN